MRRNEERQKEVSEYTDEIRKKEERKGWKEGNVKRIVGKGYSKRRNEENKKKKGGECVYSGNKQAREEREGWQEGNV